MGVRDGRLVWVMRSGVIAFPLRTGILCSEDEGDHVARFKT
jgi:hypothetical protein